MAMSDLDDLEEINLAPDRSKKSAKLSRAARKNSKLSQNKHTASKWLQQLRAYSAKRKTR
jgi:hypothetical protein